MRYRAALLSLAFLVGAVGAEGQSIRVSPRGVQLQPGDSLQLTALVPDSLAAAVRWRSTNVFVATVDSLGFVRVLRQGSASIIAYLDGDGCTRARFEIGPGGVSASRPCPVSGLCPTGTRYMGGQYCRFHPVYFQDWETRVTRWATEGWQILTEGVATQDQAHEGANAWRSLSDSIRIHLDNYGRSNVTQFWMEAWVFLETDLEESGVVSMELASPIRPAPDTLTWTVPANTWTRIEAEWVEPDSLGLGVQSATLRSGGIPMYLDNMTWWEIPPSTTPTPAGN